MITGFLFILFAFLLNPALGLLFLAFVFLGFGWMGIASF